MGFGGTMRVMHQRRALDGRECGGANRRTATSGSERSMLQRGWPAHLLHAIAHSGHPHLVGCSWARQAGCLTFADHRPATSSGAAGGGRPWCLPIARITGSLTRRAGRDRCSPSEAPVARCCTKHGCDGATHIVAGAADCGSAGSRPAGAPRPRRRRHRRERPPAPVSLLLPWLASAGLLQPHGR